MTRLRELCEVVVIAREDFEDSKSSFIRPIEVNNAKPKLLTEMEYLRVHAIQHREYLFFNVEGNLYIEEGVLNTVKTTLSWEAYE